MVSKRFAKKLMAGSLAAVMLMTSASILPAASDENVVKAAVKGDEASE